MYSFSFSKTSAKKMESGTLYDGRGPLVASRARVRFRTGSRPPLNSAARQAPTPSRESRTSRASRSACTTRAHRLAVQHHDNLWQGDEMQLARRDFLQACGRRHHEAAHARTPHETQRMQTARRPIYHNRCDTARHGDFGSQEVLTLSSCLSVAALTVEFPGSFWFWNFSSSLGSVGGMQVCYPAQPSKERCVPPSSPNSPPTPDPFCPV